VGNLLIAIDIGPDDTVRSLKERIFARDGIPENEQVLVSQGKVLQDSDLVADRIPKNNAVLYSQLRILSGSFSHL
jgi:hypothetical protein